ncbi:unnamed protein product [Lasius platythorax]|uniref:Uncharacterized protein n=1 Tax=Lasius platythorax TaxID=488582 RepID=A0AAV2MYK0_9HYME
MQVKQITSTRKPMYTWCGREDHGAGQLSRSRDSREVQIFDGQTTDPKKGQHKRRRRHSIRVVQRKSSHQ